MKLLDQVSLEEIWFLGRGAVVGVVVGTAYLATEELSGLYVMQLFLNNVSGVEAPTTGMVQRIDGRIVSIMTDAINRNMAALSLLFWATVPWLAKDDQGQRIGWLLSLCLGSLAAIVIVCSEHESSKLALFCSLLMYCVSLLSCKRSRAGLLIVWAVATLLTLPTVKIMDQLGLQNMAWVQDSARERVRIWAFTATETLNSPLIGMGANSTQSNEQRKLTVVKTLNGPHISDQQLGRHAHNVYLQTWYELGAVGALLLCVSGLICLKNIFRSDQEWRPFRMAQFAAAAALFSSSYGMWQMWLLSLLAMSAIIASITATVRR